MDKQLSRQELLAEIKALEARMVDLQDRMPAHSLPPALLAELDELDERLAELRAQLEDSE